MKKKEKHKISRKVLNILEKLYTKSVNSPNLLNIFMKFRQFAAFSKK